MSAASATRIEGVLDVPWWKERAALQNVARVTGEEVAYHRRDLIGMRLEREVAGVEEVDPCTGNVASERFGTARQEEGIVLSPRRHEGRQSRSRPAFSA
jgi:hypothetical protein